MRTRGLLCLLALLAIFSACEDDAVTTPSDGDHDQAKEQDMEDCGSAKADAVCFVHAPAGSEGTLCRNAQLLFCQPTQPKPPACVSTCSCHYVACSGICIDLAQEGYAECEASPDGDITPDGDTTPDGDAMPDGDLAEAEFESIDGDTPVDGDDSPTDGDTTPDGDTMPDGDTTPDGDYAPDGDAADSEKESDGPVDGDAEPEDETESDGEAETDLPSEYLDADLAGDHESGEVSRIWSL